MQYNIDTFIRQLQSSVAKRKYQLQTFEYALYHYREEYSVAKDKYFNESLNLDNGADFLEYLYLEMKYWKKHLNECQGRHKKLVEQQKTERKMLAYFINEKRYMSTPATIHHVPASFLSPTTSGEKEELLNTFREIAESIKRHPRSGVLVQEVFVKEEK